MILKKYFYTVTVSDNYWKVLFFFFFLPELFFIYKSRIVLTYSISGDKRLTLSFTVLNLSEPLLTSLLHIYQTTTSDKQ